jgi:hypothetical protein
MGFFPSGFPLMWWTLVLHIPSYAYSPHVGRHRRPRHGRGSRPQGGQPIHDHQGGSGKGTRVLVGAPRNGDA